MRILDEGCLLAILKEKNEEVEKEKGGGREKRGGKKREGERKEGMERWRGGEREIPLCKVCELECGYPLLLFSLPPKMCLLWSKWVLEKRPYQCSFLL